MAEYWVRVAEAEGEFGPYTGAQLIAMAAEGSLGREALVSADRAKWTLAWKVKGLFSPPRIAPSPPSAQPAPPPAPRVASIAPPPLPSSTLAQMTPSKAMPWSLGATGRSRWFLICSLVVVGLEILDILLRVGFFASIAMSHGRPGSAGISAAAVVGVTMITLRLLTMVSFVAAFIYFTVWAYLAHDEMSRLTEGTYPISPAQACGFCYIPFFNLFWVVYMPYKLALAIEQRQAAADPWSSPGAVLGCQLTQVLSVLPCACVGSPVPVFYALTVRSIDIGLKKLTAPSESDGAAAPVRPLAAPAPRQGGGIAGVPTLTPHAVGEPAAVRQKHGMPPWMWISMAAAGALVTAALLVVLCLPILNRAREQANRVKCASHMRDVGRGLIAYARTHGGTYPPRLEDAVLTGDIDPAVLLCPSSQDTLAPGDTPQAKAANLSNGGHCSYVLAVGGRRLADVNADTVILYESPGAHDGDGSNILFGDGSVSWFLAANAQSIIQQAIASGNIGRRNFSQPGSAIVAAPAPYRPPPSFGSGSPLPASAGLLSNVNPAAFTRSGTWDIADNAIRSSGHGVEVLAVPTTLPEEFNLTVDFVRIAGDDQIAIGMRVAGNSFPFLLGQNASNGSRNEPVVRGRRVQPPRMSTFGMLSAGQPHRLVIQVRKTSFRATFDQNRLTINHPHYDEWKLGPTWQAAAGDPLTLGTNNSSIEFRDVQLTPAEGP